MLIQVDRADGSTDQYEVSKKAIDRSNTLLNFIESLEIGEDDILDLGELNYSPESLRLFFKLLECDNNPNSMEYDDCDELNDLNLSQLVEMIYLVDYFDVTEMIPSFSPVRHSWVYERVINAFGNNFQNISQYITNYNLFSELGTELIVDKNFDGLKSLFEGVPGYNLSNIEGVVNFINENLWYFYPDAVPYLLLVDLGAVLPENIWFGLASYNKSADVKAKLMKYLYLPEDNDKSIDKTELNKLREDKAKSLVTNYIDAYYRSELNLNEITDVVQFGLLPDIQRLYKDEIPKTELLKYAQVSVYNDFFDAYLFFKTKGVDGTEKVTVGDVTVYPLSLSAGDPQKYNLVKALIDQVDVNAVDSSGFTLLNTANVQGLIHMISLAVDNGADPTQVTKDKTPLMWASEAGRANSFRWLLEYPEVVRRLNVVTPEGNDALMLAILNDRADIVKVLLGLPVDKLKSGVPYDLERINRKELPQPNELTKDIVNIPIHIPDIQAILTNFNREGQTPLYLAVSRGNEEIVKIILSYPEGRATIDVSRSPHASVRNMDPLKLAIERDYSNIVDLLQSA